MIKYYLIKHICKISILALLFSTSYCSSNGAGDQDKKNNIPLAFGQRVCTPINSPVIITVNAFDEDNDPLTWYIVDNAQHGMVSENFPVIIYTPLTDFSGTDTISIQVSDGISFSDAANILIDVGTCKEKFVFTVPDGRSIHGLGQYVPEFWGYSDTENWQNVKTYEGAVGIAPILYSVYMAVCPEVEEANNTDIQDITVNHDYPYIIVVGLYLLDQYESKNIHAILSGIWDCSIRSQAQAIKALDTPVFIRLGFEFGSISGIHGAFSPSEFRAIWLYVRNIFFEEEVDKAVWVWNTVNPHEFDFMDYYPGDNNVDWWGINYFTTVQITSSSGFLKEAASRGKPVMICESCPIHDGGTTVAANWNNWFVPYFNLIEQENVKAFIYINDPWDKEGFWEEWADSRINSNNYILNNYISEMQVIRYIHMNEYLTDPEIFSGE